ncbi:MAG: response regulator transcription factor [Pseudomonadota bacterium]
MNTDIQVAIVDDEPVVCRLLADAFTEAEMSTAVFHSGLPFLGWLKAHAPAVCIVDLGLPDHDGLALVNTVSRQSDAAILIVSGRAQVQDRVAGLELGADDYVIKPFDPIEVVARVRAILRRASARSGELRSDRTRRVRFGAWMANLATYEIAHSGGQSKTLSQAEASVLNVFLERPNQLLSRAQIQEAIGGSLTENFDRSIDVRVSRLRTKLDDDPRDPKTIKTIYGGGYVFVGEVTWE